MSTKHFNNSEFTHSPAACAAGVDNSLPAMFIPKREYIFGKLEQLRMFLQCPIYINSGYRNGIVNRLVGGVPSSRHIFAEAVDVTTRNKEMDAKMLRVLRYIEFRKCIVYPTFLHIELVEGDNSQIIFYKK